VFHDIEINNLTLLFIAHLSAPKVTTGGEINQINGFYLDIGSIYEDEVHGRRFTVHSRLFERLSLSGIFEDGRS
jgi:hypothetical protein